MDQTVDPRVPVLRRLLDKVLEHGPIADRTEFKKHLKTREQREAWDRLRQEYYMLDRPEGSIPNTRALWCLATFGGKDGEAARSIIATSNALLGGQGGPLGTLFMENHNRAWTVDDVAKAASLDPDAVKRALLFVGMTRLASVSMDAAGRVTDVRINDDVLNLDKFEEALDNAGSMKTEWERIRPPWQEGSVDVSWLGEATADQTPPAPTVPAAVRPDYGSLMSFIHSSDLRTIVADDSENAHRCFDAGAQKACMILAGSAIEAALLDVLERRGDLVEAELTTPKKSAPKNWADVVSLRQMVDLADRFGLVSKHTVGAAEIAADSRDLVHPNRMRAAPRDRVVVSERHADLMLVLLRLVLGDLSDAAKDGRLDAYLNR